MEERALGGFSYRIIVDPAAATAHLRQTLEREWRQDLEELPEQPWTRRWLTELERCRFEPQIVRLADVRPLQALMDCRTDKYVFRDELADRVSEARDALLASRTIEPIVLLRNGLELIDGHMRFTFLVAEGEAQAYAYVGERT